LRASFITIFTQAWDSKSLSQLIPVHISPHHLFQKTVILNFHLIVVNDVAAFLKVLGLKLCIYSLSPPCGHHVLLISFLRI